MQGLRWHLVDVIPREAGQDVKSEASLDVAARTLAEIHQRSTLSERDACALMFGDVEEDGARSPQRDLAPVVDHPVGVGVPVGEEEVHGYVGEKDELHALEVQHVLREAPEEGELEGGEEGGVDGPHEHRARPDPVPPAHADAADRSSGNNSYTSRTLA